MGFKIIISITLKNIKDKLFLKFGNEYMLITSWPSPAKLNLFLYVSKRRKDGYYDLKTLFQFLNYGDILYIKINNSGHIKLNKKIKGIPYENNLIIRAAKLLMKKAKIKSYINQNAGVEIHINKYIPISSGLGGGSSNAATILIALNYLWNIGFSVKTLKKIGLTLGADIPIFIHGYASFAEGIGEKLSPAYPSEKWYVVIYPKVKISTAMMFNLLNLNNNFKEKSYSDIMLSPFSNDFEPIIRKSLKIEKIFLWLLQYAPFRLTGTGSCFFSSFETKNEASQVLFKIQQYFQGFIAKGTNISPLYYVLNMIK